MRLTPDRRLRYDFESSPAVRFEIHYHAGTHVHYPLTPTLLASHAGQLTTDVERVYCLMWVNPGPAAATVRHGWSLEGL